MSWFDRMGLTQILKAGNPYHDEKGRFTSGSGGTAVRGAGRERAENARNLGDTSASMNHHSKSYYALKDRPDNRTRAVREAMKLHEKAYHAHGRPLGKEDKVRMSRAREASRAAHEAEDKLPKL